MRRRIPSLQALGCFEAAARQESYTRAADELGMTQGAVSRQIASLESYLGVALFRRTRHGVVLTPGGAQYARQVGLRLAMLERDTLDAMAHQSGSGGTLQLASVATFATRWLIPRLASLRLAHPDLVVHIDVRTRPFLFADGDFDAAVFSGTPEQVAHWPGVRAERLMDEVVVPVASPALKATRRRWRAVDVAAASLLQSSTRPQAWRQWFEAHGVQEAPGALAGPRLELFSMLAEAAAQGLGIALLPRLLIQPELASGALAVLIDDGWRSQRDYYLVTPDRPPSPGLVAFQQWIVAQAGLGATNESNP